MVESIFIIIIGLSVGSFLNVVILRIQRGTSPWKGRSTCMACDKALAWNDLIPIVSYLALGGYCRYCKAKISFQYPLVEGATALLFFGAYSMVFPLSGNIHLFSGAELGDLFILLRNWVGIAVLIILFVYDLRWFLILDAIAIPAIIVVYLFNGIFFYHTPACVGLSLVSCVLSISLMNYLLAVVIGGGFFLIQYLISRGAWIGGGDIRLGAFMGAFLGFPQILIALFFAYMIGSLVALPLVFLKKKEMRSEIPFAPFLAIATVITLFWGESILQLYSSAFFHF
ncbi:prepilin peptidase [Candidatus Uhrbacteria bacterium]|nr:prepilin peptidase [Candidatus Uhrbacteria bacterium]